MDQETTIHELREQLRKFNEDRDWGQFHNPKDLAEAISIESAELLELVLWRNPEAILEKLQSDPEYKKDISEELADIIAFCFNFANATGLDVSEILKNKIQKNGEKYPIKKARGVADKYNKLQ